MGERLTTAALAVTMVAGAGVLAACMAAGTPIVGTDRAACDTLVTQVVAVNAAEGQGAGEDDLHGAARVAAFAALAGDPTDVELRGELEGARVTGALNRCVELAEVESWSKGATVEVGSPALTDGWS
jgi:hypothetical protein